jgi:hypothetical protein
MDNSLISIEKEKQDSILPSHQALIDLYWPAIANSSEEITDKILLTSTDFKGSTLYPEGINMSLWHIEPTSKLCIVANSGNISLVGGLWGSGDRRETMIFNVGIDSQCPRMPISMDIKRGSKTQISVQELLFNWAIHFEKNKAKETQKTDDINQSLSEKAFLQLIKYDTGVKVTDAWHNRLELRNPQMYLSYRAMNHYLTKFWDFDKGLLIGWLDKNLKVVEGQLPRIDGF